MLPIKRIVNVTIDLSPTATSARAFSHLIIGDTPIIPVSERIRSYSSLEDVIKDFGTTSPEYQASSLFFSQTPTPSKLDIAYWVSEGTSASLQGGTIDDTGALLTQLQAVTDGAFDILVDNTSYPVSGCDFSSVANMGEVATLINTKLTSCPAQLEFSNNVFKMVAKTELNSIAFPTAPSTGTDISGMLKLTEATGATIEPKVTAETPAEIVALLADKSLVWYSFAFASNKVLTNTDILDVATLVEGFSNRRCFAVTTSDASALTVATDSLPALLKAGAYKNTVIQYSSFSKYAINSFISKLTTVNYNLENSTLTMKFKQEPGVLAEDLSSSQADNLKANNCNVFAKFDNETSIIVEGTMVDGEFCDNYFNLEWLKRTLQAEMFNVLYTAKKIKQTNQGVATLINAIGQVMSIAIRNGTIAEGQWNGTDIGELRTGDYMPTGWYVYAQNIAEQLQSDREKRVAPPIYLAIKLAGAIHSVDCLVTVNR